MASNQNITIVLTDHSTSTSNETHYFEGDALTFSLHIVDYVVIGLYLICSLVLGFYLSRNQKTTADYFLAGKSSNWVFIGMSLFASDVSSSSLVGLAGAAYSKGISVYNYIWIASVILIIYSVLFVAKILKMELYTIPEYLERRFHKAAKYYLSVLTMLLWFLGAIAGGLFAGSMVMRMTFPQLETWHAAAILAAIAGIYTISGGLQAVIYTDAFQTVTLLLGSVMISVYALIEAGGWNTVKESVSPDYLSLIRPIDDPNLPWTGAMTGIPILGIYYWCCNQSIVQRVLSAKDTNHGRLGCVFGGFLRLPLLFIMVLPGTMAKVIYPDLPKGDLVYPVLLFRLLPIGVKGIVLSGFLAALMSAVDSVLNSAATLVTMDFVKKWKPNMTDTQLIHIGRFVTFLFLIISICWTPLLERFSSLYEYAQTILSYLIPQVAALYLAGFFWKGANNTGAFVSIVFGNIAAVVFFVINEITDIYKIHFLHVAAILFLVSFVGVVVGSIVKGTTDKKDDSQFIWSSKEFIEEIKSLKDVPIYENYIIHSLILLFVTGVIVGLFW